MKESDVNFEMKLWFKYREQSLRSDIGLELGRTDQRRNLRGCRHTHLVDNYTALGNIRLRQKHSKRNR